jgi:septal ring factor EnvC (AmiA/AmiB activator)
MIEELTAQQQDEVEHRDYCTKEFNQNDKNVFDRNDEKGDLQRKIQELTNTIATLTQEIADHNTEIAATQVSIKKAGEDREAENADFQTTVADQRATQQILDKVVQRLGQFYKKALLQQEPPVKFGEYKSNQGSSSVLALLDKIIEDSKTVESEAISAEKAAQAEYEATVAASNAAIKANQEAIAQKSDSKATANADKSAAESDLQKTQNALDQLAQYRADLHASCDFTMKNFEVRQTARREEMDAIRQAKAILSGAQ